MCDAAKCRPWVDGDLALCQEASREGVRAQPGRGDVGHDIERAFRDDRQQAGLAQQVGDEVLTKEAASFEPLLL